MTLTDQDLNSNLNAQLAWPVLSAPAGRGFLAFAPGDSVAWAEVTSYDPKTNLGLVQLPTTKLLRAFRVLKDAKTRACRDHQPEVIVQLLEIETVATPGGIEAALGEVVQGPEFRVVTTALFGQDSFRTAAPKEFQ